MACELLIGKQEDGAHAKIDFASLFNLLEKKGFAMTPGGDSMDSHNASDNGVPMDDAQKNLIRIYLRQAMVRGELPMRQFLQHLEKRLIVLALIFCSGSLHGACEMLHVKKTTLHEKIRKYKICADTEFAPDHSLAAVYLSDFAMDREGSDD